MTEYQQPNHKLRKELINLLLERASYAQGDYPRRKVKLWHFTVGSAYLLKRTFDLVLCFVGLIVLSPLLAVIALWIKLDSAGPIISTLTRVGKNGRHFHFYKFRSMYTDADRRRAELAGANESADGVLFKMKNDPRTTRSGRFLRKFSLDELPQLFNVILGDMSLVGPRPPLPSEVALYTLEDRKRLHITPGITGLCQVSGRSDLPFKQQVELDKAYIQSQSFGQDLLILLKTIPAVLTGRGAY